MMHEVSLLKLSLISVVLICTYPELSKWHFFLLQGGETYMYRYGEAGRLESVILPTGETMSLSSHLTEDDSLAVQVAAPVQSLSVAVPEQPAVTTLKMMGRGAHRLSIREGLYCFVSCLLQHQARG
jgi:hypothetical protein